MNMQCQKGGPPCAGHRVASADDNAGITQSDSPAAGVAFGTASALPNGTVVRKRLESYAFRYGHDGVWTKWPSPKKEAWT